MSYLLTNHRPLTRFLNDARIPPDNNRSEAALRVVALGRKNFLLVGHGWRGFGKEAKSHPPMRGWLAAPLIGSDGKNLGLVQLSDKYEGDFDEKDEAILVQLAKMASAAVENARLYHAA